MFDVLVFVYENYWRGDSCPEPSQLARKLNAVGFEAEEIRDALDWLDGLSIATRNLSQQAFANSTPAPSAVLHAQSALSMRVYSSAEQDRLGAECLGFISFMESSGVLPASLREIVLDRALVASGDTLSLDDLKIIILLVYWSFGQEPDALILDALCEDSASRVAH